MAMRTRLKFWTKLGGAAALWALGPASGPTGRALTTAIAPELELPDVDGNPFKLSSLLGQKVLLVAWATW